MALVLVLIALGSIAFHVLSPWWWTPIASNWGYIDTTLIITFWITGAVFTILVLFVAYCVARFRHRPGQKASYEPESRRLEGWLTAITAIGVAAMLAPGLAVWAQFVRVPADAAEVEIVAQQWRWSYRLPGADGRLGAAATEFVSDENPLGLDPHDPAAIGAAIRSILADPLHHAHLAAAAAAGTPGKVLRLDPEGKPFVLLDSPFQEIRTLRFDDKGQLYVAALSGRSSSSGSPRRA